MATVNTELLKATLEHIKDNPETWDQGQWCGTAQCFAGWAVSLAGMLANPETDCVYVDDMPAELMGVVHPDIEKVSVREAAVIALGIIDAELIDNGPEGSGEPEEAAAVLFYAGNELEDLERFVADLCSETGEATS